MNDTTRDHTRRLRWLPLALETLGTILIFMEVFRLNAMVKILGYVSFDAEPAKVYGCWYHSAPLGFLLVFAGIILHWRSVWLAWASLRRAGLMRTESHPNQQAS